MVYKKRVSILFFEMFQKCDLSEIPFLFRQDLPCVHNETTRILTNIVFNNNYFLHPVCRSFTGDFNTSPMTPVTISNRPTTPSHHNVSTTEMTTTSTTVVSSPPPRPTKPTYTRPTTVATTTTTTVTTTTAATPAEYFKVVCYFTNWAWYRYEFYGSP